MVLKAACARNEAEIKKFAAQWGYESTETDWRKLVERPDIDVIDICTPNNLHKEIALAAAANEKAILCEKPLAMNTAEGARDGRGGGESRRAEHGLVQLPGASRRSRWRRSSSTKGDSAASSTTARNSSKIGRSKPICRKAGKACGGSMSRRPAVVSPVTCSRTASTRQSG